MRYMAASESSAFRTIVGYLGITRCVLPAYRRSSTATVTLTAHEMITLLSVHWLQLLQVFSTRFHQAAGSCRCLLSDRQLFYIQACLS